MTKISNQYSLTNILTADLANSRLGINNVSPTVALDVTGAGRFSGAVTFGNDLNFSATDSAISFASGAARFFTGGSERMRIASDGTKYFGTFNTSRLQINPTGENVYSYTNNYYIYGLFNDSNSLSIESAFAGNIIFRAQAQSTSSSPTTATERMRITSAGNVGIGTSAPRATLDVSDGTVNTSGEAIYQGLFTGPSRPSTSDLTAILTIQSNDAMAINKGGSIAFGGRAVASNSAGANWAGISGLKENATGSDYSGYLQFWTRGGSSSEKMRITSAGYLLVGSASDLGRIEITSRQDFQQDFLILRGTQLYFGVNYSFQIVTSTQDFRIWQGSERFRISANGSIGAGGSTNNIYNASDVRLKQNIVPINSGLDKIKALNPVKFNWADGFEPNEANKTLLGFIAQEVNEVIPEAIESFGGDINLNGKLIDNPLRVNEKFIIPVLVKAIQELSAKVSLLENK
jgi:hypothetical protein